MVVESGVESLTMLKLATALDLTPGALYRYFRNKAEIISALEAQVLRELSERMSTEMAALRLPGDPAEAAIYRLWASAYFYLRQRREHPAHAGLISLLLADPKHHVSVSDLPAVSVEFIGIFTQLINQFRDASECQALAAGDAQRRALVFWSSLQGVSTLDKLCRVDPEFFDPTRAGAELIATLLEGWGADPACVQQQRSNYQSQDGAPSMSELPTKALS
jgi:AcrR family transcriptional regulator